MKHVQEANRLLTEKAKGTECTYATVQKHIIALSSQCKAEVVEATLLENGVMNWTVFEELEAEMNGAKKSGTQNKKGLK